MNEKKLSYEELEKRLTKAEGLLDKFQQTGNNATGNGHDTSNVDAIDLAQAYIASEQNFKNSMDTSPLGIRIVTEDGALIYANKAALDIFGYKTVEELAAVKRSELYTPESYAAYQERKRKRKLNEQIPGEYEISIRRPDGEVRNLMVFRREVMWGGEKQYIAMYEDITERKRAEQALKESEEKYHNLVEHCNDGIVYIEDKLIQYCNSKMLEISGYSMEELIGKPFIDFIVPEQKNNAAETYKQRVAGMKVPDRYELDLISKDGTIIHTEISANLFSYKQKTVDAVIVRDITDRKKMDEALKKSEREKATILNGVSELVAYQDRELRIIWANKAAGESVGQSPESLVGRHCYEIWQNRSEPCVGCPLIESFATGQPQQTEMTTSDGRIWFIRGYPIRDENDNIIGATEVTLEITDRKRTEEALKESQEMFSLAFRDSPNLIAISSLKEGKLIEVNDAYCQATGYSRDELIGHTALELNLWHDPDQRSAMVESLKEKRAISNAEMQIRTKSGEIRTIYLSISKITVKNEPCLISIASDITEQKRAKEALEESEARFNKAFHASPNLMAVLSLDEGRFIDANAEHARITGYERQEIIGKTTLELNLWANPEQRKDFYKIINTEGRLKDYETLMRTKSGEFRTLLFSAERIILRGNNCLVVSALDITERKEAEDRINHLNLMLHSVRNVSQLITREKDRSLLIQKICDSLVESRSFKSSWIVLLDENQQPVIWAGSNTNKEFPALIESMKQGQMPLCVNKALKEKQVIIIEDPATACSDCPALCGNADIGIMAVRLEIEGVTYGVLCASISTKLIRDSEEISLFSEIATDIAFTLRDIELVATNELREKESLRMAKMETIGMLAGGIAHDFNNLLTGIMGNIGLVKTYVSSSDPTYEMLDEAEAAAVRARDLTQQLLTFAKGGKPLKKMVNATELIKESAEFALRGSKVKLELVLPDDLWQIEADEGQISQVINNLVINADEAMPGGGMLKISAENQAVKKSDALPLQRGNYVRIDIVDTGIGMSEEQLQSIFEPYFTTKQRGSGLGLTTAYSVVKNHNGAILAESTQNKGSTFHIYLPATKKALKGAKKLTVEESGQAGGKVLIMDDEEIIRKMLANMLGMAGYIVEVSADGVEALEKYQQAKKARDPFSAVIMDLTIPGGMGGREAVKKLLEIDPEATVIVSSGYATDPIMSEYRKYGFKAVIAKPYSVKQLRELLSKLLSKKKR